MDKGSYVIMNLLQLYLDCVGNMLYLLWGSCTFWEVHTVCFAEINQQYFYLLHVSLVLVGINFLVVLEMEEATGRERRGKASWT